MSTTQNTIIDRKDTVRGSLPVAATTHIYENSLVYNAAGYADDDTGSGANKFEGIAVKEVNNTGSAGDEDCEIYREGVFPLVGSGFTQASVGKLVYGTDNNTITLDGSTANAVLIGISTALVSSTVLDVLLLTDRSGLAGDRIVEVSVPIGLHATKTVFNLFTAREALQVLNIDYTPDIAQGGALTATVVKATGTATPASATTPMHAAAAINLNGTAHTVQPMTLTSTAADLLLAAGERIGFVESGAMTVGSGVVTIRMKRLA